MLQCAATPTKRELRAMVGRQPEGQWEINKILLYLPFSSRPGCLWGSLDPIPAMKLVEVQGEEMGRAGWTMWDRIQHAVLLKWPTPPTPPRHLFYSLHLPHVAPVIFPGLAEHHAESGTCVEPLAIAVIGSVAHDSSAAFRLLQWGLWQQMSRFAPVGRC